MPTRNTPVGAPIWNDLATHDLNATVTFYTNLFGWGYENFGPEFGNYGQFTKNGRKIAGIGPVMEVNQPDVWGVYLLTRNARATQDAASAAGAQVVAPAMEIPDQGTMAILADPSGALIGLWEPAGHNGFEVADEDGAPIWHELHTTEYERAVAFYRDVLGWSTNTVADTPQFRYTTDEVGGIQYCGIYDCAGNDGAVSHWKVYFGADDVDGTVERAVGLGAKVTQPPVDTPYGRTAELTDPTGASFRVNGIPDPE